MSHPSYEQPSLFASTSAFEQVPPDLPAPVVAQSQPPPDLKGEALKKIALLLEDVVDGSEEIGRELLQEALEIARDYA